MAQFLFTEHASDYVGKYLPQLSVDGLKMAWGDMSLAQRREYKAANPNLYWSDLPPEFLKSCQDQMAKELGAHGRVN